jgi:hypothetical protein
VKKKFAILSLFLGSLGWTCKNDLDITEDWQEIPVVFGLLDQSDTAQYIKINKAFLGKENALVMASSYDTINYGSQLQVVINEISNNTVLNSWTLQRDTSIGKPAGVFAYPHQVLYKLASQPLDPNNEYELVVTNGETGHQCRSKTRLVSNFSAISPYPNQTINFTIPNSDFHVSWLSAEYGRRYNLVIRFWYTEVNKFTSVVTEKHIDLQFPDQLSTSIKGNENMEYAFQGKTFYTFLRAQLQPNDSVWRHVGKLSNAANQLDFIISVAGEDFATYMDINAPSTGILQEKPYFTNIDGGIGLFSSRFVQKSPWLYNRQLSGASVDSIYAGQYTYDLGFCSTNSQSPYFCN